MERTGRIYSMTDSFPRQQARTRRFSCGVPRSFQISPDGRRIVFLRSRGGTDPDACLWVLDLPADGAADGAAERLVIDPTTIAGDEEEPDEERARRERSRERAGGVVAFGTDASCEVAAFALAGRVYATRLAPGEAGPAAVPAMSPAIDPRPDPSGRRVAYVANGALRVTDLLTSADSELIGPGDEADVSYGLAEFVAAEEMGRYRGYWWSPDGSALLVARVDNAPVQRWYIADPANPGRPPAQVRYPSAGTPNAAVSLLIVRLDGTTTPVRWDADAFPYLAVAGWDAGGALLAVQSRDQRLMRLLLIDDTSGDAKILRSDSDPNWLDIVPGTPGWTSDGRIVWTTTADGARRLLVTSPDELGGDPEPVTPAGMQVRQVLSVDGDTVLFTATGADPTEIGVWAYGPSGLVPVSEGSGVWTGTRSGGTTVLTRRSLDEPDVRTTVLRPAGAGVVATIGSLAEAPVITPSVRLLRGGERELRTALLLPSGYEPGSGGPLPVLMDPYGGPHKQRVVASCDEYLASQWFADQGFAVIIADGRGTPGRGPAWDRAVFGDLAGPVLADQVDALASVAQQCARDGLAELDLGRVGIRGWSFGGYLAALAVLRRPDVFGAAVAGAPVTDWRLYDTHYTERYLGDPAVNGGAYDQSSLIADARALSRPLMIIHGLADDNVVVAHTLRLSSALLAAGRPHTVLPLSGVTHMPTQEDATENMLLLQVAFLKTALAIPESPDPTAT
jgi:dipeptidyl-peptidase-4